MRCPVCAFENPAASRFCGSCGNGLTVVCPACGAENPPDFRFCGSCGTALETPVESPAGAPLAGERRRVTVLFADLVGFSTLAEHLDPEELRLLMADTFSELTEEVERREGTVEKFIGDAVVAIFGAPVAHEDDPARAVETALTMLEAVRRRSEASAAPLELRVGINTGLVVAGAVGDGSQTGVMGDAVNTAARLQQAAGPGEVLVAASTWRQVRDRFAAEPVGELEVKGRAAPVDAYRVTGRREAEPRLRSPFVGRSEELALIDLLWASASRGNTHVVSVSGEPGVGKSRILAELGPRSDALDIRIACGGERAFGPFVDLLSATLGGLPASVEELTEKAGALGLESEDALLLAAFLGLGEAPAGVRMGDEQRKRQVYAGVWQLLIALCRDRPLFLALDDVHWADESSRDLLGFLLERLGGVPLLLLLTYRPGFEQIERTELRASHTAVRLEPLTPEESVALARGFLGVEALPGDLEELVASRAEGNPFFIEELLQALLELGSLAVVDGRAALAKVDVEIPDTVQGTILARIDRLDARERALLQRAAVLGRNFSTAALERVTDDPSTGPGLTELARAQLLVEQGPGEWAFKHALIQEVAYDTLLLRQRRELHLGVAEALERDAGDDPALLEALAEHYARAEVPEKARSYAVAAGDLARERVGFVEAARRYETALRLWGEGDEAGRLELLSKLGDASLLAGDLAAARTALVEAADGWRSAGDLPRAGSALASLGRVYWVGGDGARGMDAAQEAIDTLEPLGPSAELVKAYAWLATAQMLEGTVDRSLPLAERGLALAEELGLDGLRSQLLNTAGTSLVGAGELAGLERIREALAVARQVDDAEALGRAYVNLGSVLGEVGRLAEAVEVDEEGRAAMRRRGSPQFEWFIAGNEAGSLVDLGRLAEAEALATEMLGEHRAVLGTMGVVNAEMVLTEVRLRRGDLAGAEGAIEEMLPLARGIGGAEFLAQTLEIVARFEHARGNLAAARSAAREALEIVTVSPAFQQWLRILPAASRLLAVEEIEPLVGQLVEVTPSPMNAARLAEIDGVRGDRERALEAAEIYRELEMPYQEARCRLDAGELDRARELIERFGFEHGPLGAALAELDRA